MPLKCTEEITKSLIVMDLQWLCLRSWRDADQRQCPPIYLISMIQTGPDMQVYQRLYWINSLYIFYNSILEGEHQFWDNLEIWMSLWHEIGARAQPHFSRGTGMVDLTDLPNACPLVMRYWCLYWFKLRFWKSLFLDVCTHGQSQLSFTPIYFSARLLTTMKLVCEMSLLSYQWFNISIALELKSLPFTLSSPASFNLRFGGRTKAEHTHFCNGLNLGNLIEQPRSNTSRAHLLSKIYRLYQGKWKGGGRFLSGEAYCYR